MPHNWNQALHCVDEVKNLLPVPRGFSLLSIPVSQTISLSVCRTYAGFLCNRRHLDSPLNVCANMAPEGRLKQLLHTLDTSPSRSTIGTLKVGSITYPIPSSLCPSRLARAGEFLDVEDSFNLDNLHWMLQKYVLGQDIFLVSQPGPYARRLAMSFAR